MIVELQVSKLRLNLEGYKNYMAELEKHVIMDEDLCVIASKRSNQNNMR